MAVDVRCDNCEDNLGKCTENSTEIFCGNCGNKQTNWQLRDYYPEIWKETLAEEKKYKQSKKG